MPQPPDSPPPLQAEQRVREALAGAGTSVWEWHIDSDLLKGTRPVKQILCNAKRRTNQKPSIRILYTIWIT